ncbi:MAG TPA: TerB family tellurite resistance protein [Bacteroidales bacterium]|jgi:DnaJ like chaperone protein|nr:TerB family tellurite resistance protein [Bacteroidales bacterium]
MNLKNNKYGKWIGAGLGWTIGGPIGAVLGFAFGSFVDSSDLAQFNRRTAVTTKGDFIVSLLVLIAAIMKADQRILRSELNFVKTYFIKSFGEEETSEMLKMLRDIIKQDIPLREVTGQIRSRMDYSSRLQLMHLIFGIAFSDGEIKKSELIQIEQTGIDLGISTADINSLKGMFIKSSDWAYEVLEVSRSDGNEDIRKKYRQLALKNHPDKVAYLGEEIRKRAEEKFGRIQEAWETVKDERGIG